MAKWTWHHLTVFLLTFFGYALFHCCRKSWSNVKDTFQKEVTPANLTNPVLPYDVWEKRQMFNDLKDADVFTGVLDTLFLAAYAIGLYLSGVVGDRMNLRYVLSGGMFLSAIAMFVFGYLTEVTGTRNKYFYGVVYFICGLLQSTGWPATVAIMGNWFGKHGRGFVFGIWSANASLGNIIGSVLVSRVLDYGYDYGMLVTSYILFCGGIIILFCLYASPEEAGLPPADDDEENYSNRAIAGSIITHNVDREPLLRDPTSESDETAKRKQAISLLSALLLPGVIPYSLAYACLKLVNYSFFFWLPVYLVQGLGWADKKSDELSNFYDAGGIAGGIIAGVISDLIGKRSPVMVIFLIYSVGSLYWYNNVGSGYTLNVCVMTLTGFLIGGPANIISSAISADLGKQKGVRGSKQALATVTGIVDGTGSIGAAIGQILVPVINREASWHMVFNFLILMTIMSVVCILPMLYKDIKLWIASRRRVYVAT